MIYRIYTEKKPQFAVEAAGIYKDIRENLGITALKGLRVFNRYDVEGIDQALFDACIPVVFAEPPVDLIHQALPPADHVLAVEYLPGQFDQRANSCSECIQFVSGGERPLVGSSRIYLLEGHLSPEELTKIKTHLINPVESREAALTLPATIAQTYPQPAPVARLNGFCLLEQAGLAALIRQWGLAMDIDDIALCRDYFRSENRDPSITELKLIDTYWSDHCRHTTFGTELDDPQINDPTVLAGYQRYLELRQQLQRQKKVTLMDIATIGGRYLKAQGKLNALDESEEINACTVRAEVDINGEIQPWLLLFKNETHNHPTEIEPFGGAATCIGGAIRDPLSGRGYVYQALRLTGAGDPTGLLSDTLPGKLPQRKIVTAAAAGYSSYGNQIGLATGLVDEVYHPGYVAKRMEVGAVIAAVPQANVRRESPIPGDVVVLLGGRTGRDGMGGATGSSKSHSAESLATCGAEVQKGNAPEERKLQRLFRNPQAARMIKRCNDFGAGGVAVAIGELAAGLDINLDKVPKKYEGLDGTELAISESQERMAVVLDAQDQAAFLNLAAAENLEATVVASVKQSPRLTMTWQGQTIVDIAREFLDSNGAPKHNPVAVAPAAEFCTLTPDDLQQGLASVASDLNCCSKQGLAERFDSTIGGGTLLAPFGGSRQSTPIQAMAAKLPVPNGETTTCSLMSWGFNPHIGSPDPYRGAYLAVVESVSKIIATGGDITRCYLSFQEFFPKLRQDKNRWGLPFASLLGALNAQLDLGLAAIGGKDSMSGSFEELDVPPTLISFAAALGNVAHLCSPEWKQPGSKLYLLAPTYDSTRMPESRSLLAVYAQISALIHAGHALSTYALCYGGAAAGLLKMALGNGLGCRLQDEITLDQLFAYGYGSFLVEVAADAPAPAGATLIGEILPTYHLYYRGEIIPLLQIEKIYNARLENVFPCHPPENTTQNIPLLSWDNREQLPKIQPRCKMARPRVLIPVFPGTNCEYDTAAAFARVGAEPHIEIIRNINSAALADSVAHMAKEIAKAQIIMIPGGFSGGDEPDGSGKFITAFFRNPLIREAIETLLDHRDGLMGGICNGFQALIKLGLVPFGHIRDAAPDSPTLTFNTIGRHQSRLIRSRITAIKSPWLSLCQNGDIHTIAISHGEGRFVCAPELLQQLAQNGQIAAQYVDDQGLPTMDIHDNPNGSYQAVEAVTSPDGRIFGRMGHPERATSYCLQNIPGDKDAKMFAGAVAYFTS